MKIFNRIKQIGLKASCLKVKQWLFTPSAEVIDLCARNGAYEYLQRYKYACDNLPTSKIQPKEKIIWTCWLQGEENAPLIVQRCLDSMRKHAGDYKVVVLTQETISKYILVPDHINQKHEKGIIPHAHYTDIIRLLLLKQYGGVWVDSTILLTDVIPQYIRESSMFMFKRRPIGHVEIENSFLVCDKEHPIICAVLETLLKYWREENKLISYSIFHLAWTMAAHSSKEIEEKWNDVPFVPCELIDVLMHELSLKYSDEKWRTICSVSSIHKLSYKYDQFGIDTKTQGTFYDVLINGNKPC